MLRDCLFHRKEEYENYFSELGMTNIIIYSDRFIDTSPENPCLEEVSAVFATPPNSYSAVADPIDLVITMIMLLLLQSNRYLTIKKIHYDLKKTYLRMLFSRTVS